MAKTIRSEEDLIRRFLAPLAKYPGAFDLADDCALLTPKAGADLVLTTDAIAAGVHFFPDDAPDDIAWKALAVNVSDLAGKAAEPLAYLMALAFPAAPDEAWLKKFSAGLKSAQEAFGISLIGGDTDRRPGPLTINITAVGTVPSGTFVQRTAANAGDRIFVSGTLGDAALGLKLRRDEHAPKSWGLTKAESKHLLQRYLRPAPRLALRKVLRASASAAMDVSDGLAKDLARMCNASGCGARIECERLPLSPAVRKAVTADRARLSDVIGGGDDYEILAAVPSVAAKAYQRAANATGIGVTEIGEFTSQQTVVFTGSDGNRLDLDKTGWAHFAPTR